MTCPPGCVASPADRSDKRSKIGPPAPTIVLGWLVGAWMAGPLPVMPVEGGASPGSALEVPSLRERGAPHRREHVAARGARGRDLDERCPSGLDQRDREPQHPLPPRG